MIEEVIPKPQNVVEDSNSKVTDTIVVCNTAKKEKGAEELLPSNFVVSAEDLLKFAPEVLPSLLAPILPKTGVVAIAGASEAGKSNLIRQLAIDIVSGKTDFLGFKLEAQHKRVLYISTEDDRNGVSISLKKQNPTIDPNKSYERLGFIFDTDYLEKKIKKVLEKHQIDCLMVDTFEDLFSGDMNSSSKIREFVQLYSKLAQKYKFLVIFLHHTGKRTEDNSPSKNNLLGSQGFESKMRLVIELRKDPKEPKMRHLCIVKGNYLPQEYKEKSFKLLFDDNLRFTNTGIRVPFDDLNKKEPTSKFSPSTKEEVIKLHAEKGMSTRAISDHFKEKGLKVSKSAINNWIAESEPPKTSQEIFSEFVSDEDVMGD